MQLQQLHAKLLYNEQHQKLNMHACVWTKAPPAQMQRVLGPVELQNKYESAGVGCVVPTMKTNKMATVPGSASLARWLAGSASQLANRSVAEGGDSPGAAGSGWAGPEDGCAVD